MFIIDNGFLKAGRPILILEQTLRLKLLDVGSEGFFQGSVFVLSDLGGSMILISFTRSSASRSHLQPFGDERLFASN